MLDQVVPVEIVLSFISDSVSESINSFSPFKIVTKVSWGFEIKALILTSSIISYSICKLCLVLVSIALINTFSVNNLWCIMQAANSSWTTQSFVCTSLSNIINFRVSLLILVLFLLSPFIIVTNTSIGETSFTIILVLSTTVYPINTPSLVVLSIALINTLSVFKSWSISKI